MIGPRWLLLALALVACTPTTDRPPGPDGPGPGDPDPDDPDPDDPDPEWPPDDELDWSLANLTNFESYPEPGSKECEEFNGCTWAGYFAFLDGQQSYDWVASTNIAAVHSDHADTYGMRTLRVRDDDSSIDVVVYDLCSDWDCDGCCSRNASETGFLIDLEIHTAERLGTWHGVVEWACLDCE